MLKSLLIRAEDKNKWEKRAPIVPNDLKDIVGQTGAKAYIQTSSKRFFSESEYQNAGAEKVDDMSKGDVIFGVKEIPEEKILNNKVYMFFSHTIKGQKSGMPLLKKIMESGSTLIDYEKITDEQNRRLIFFGRYAGDAGTIDILWLAGQYLKAKGIETPFMQVKQALEYQSVEDAGNHIKKVGQQIESQGFPQSISPFVIGIAGYGNVSSGVQHILSFLPTETIEPENLESFIKSKKGSPNKVYVTIFKEKDMVKRKDGGKFELADYYKNPQNYESTFEQYLPYLSILTNAIYWESKYPRFVTWDSLKRLYQKEKTPKLFAIADITCDVEGAIECTVKGTDSGMPAYICNPIDKTVTDGNAGDGVLVLAVDNLPCELPHDSSTFFSGRLKEFVPNMLKADYSANIEKSGLAPEIQKATIVYNGKLTEPFKYLEKHLG